MKLPKKRYLIPSVGLVVLAILLAAAVVILPRIIAGDAVKQRIESTLSTLAGGKVRYSRALLQFRPLPRILFESGVIDIPGRLTGTVETLSVHPRLLPLLVGRIEIGRLRLVRPRLRILLPANTASTPQSSGLSRVHALGKGVAGLIAAMGHAFSGDTSLAVTDGGATLISKHKKSLVLHHIRGHLAYRPARLLLRLNEGSPGAGEMRLGVDLDPRRMTGSARIHLSRFSPHEWMGILSPENPLRVGESRLNLDLDLNFEKPGTLSGTVACTLARLTLMRSKQRRVIRDGDLDGAFTLGPNRTELTLSDLDLAEPRLKMTGRYLSNGDTGTHRWEITACNLDLASTGRLVRFLARGIHPLQSAFQTLQAGRVTEIKLSDAADSLADLKKARGLRIRGYLEDGTIYIPKPDLTLTHASGWINVWNRTLMGDDLHARLGKAMGHGAFAMTFERHPPFLLDTAVTADLSELPPLLERLVPNKIFKQEMASIHGAEGKAEGRLRIEHATGRELDVKVDVSRMNLSGTYQRIPYPIQIRQGRFRYDKDGVQLDDLEGRIGASEFSGLAANIGLHPPFPLAIKGQAPCADMEQVLRWLRQYRGVARILTPIKQLAGPVSLSDFSMKGPAISPSQWQLNLAGRLKGVRAITSALPSPVLFREGTFEADRNAICFFDTHMETMDTRLAGRGILQGYLTSTPKIETTLSGSVGPQSASWARKSLGLPGFLSWQSPRKLSAMNLRWSRRSGLALTGTLKIPDGPILQVRLKKTPGRLAIHRLAIHDAQSDATASLMASKDAVDLTFSGQVNGRSLNRLISGKPFLSGLIAGDVQSHLQLTAPQLSTVEGHLKVKKLDLSRFAVPLDIHEADLSGRKDLLRIQRADLTWQHQRLRLDGTVTGHGDGLHLDLTASAKKVLWSDLTHFLDGEARRASKQKGSTPHGQIPLDGSLKVHADSLVVPGGMAFEPMEAHLNFHDGKTDVSITHATLCGIDLTGNAGINHGAYHLEATPAAKNQDLAATLACLSGNRQIITGRFALNGQLRASGRIGVPLTDTLSGRVSLKSEKGRVLRFGLMAKLFTLLNVEGLFQGQLPDLEAKGFPYKSAEATATFDRGILHIADGEINSNAMHIFFQGKENLTKKTHDLTIVVAPLKTIDLLVSHIPLVRNVLNKGLVIYPITVTGTWDKPNLNLVAPDAVGIQIWGVVVRTLKLPLTILDPLFSVGKKKSPH